MTRIFLSSGGGVWTEYQKMYRTSGGGSWAQVTSAYQTTGGGAWSQIYAFGGGGGVIPVVSNLNATDASTCSGGPSYRINLTWSSVGSFSYNIYRDGGFIASTGATSYADFPSQGTHSYFLRTVSASVESANGNTASATATNTCPDAIRSIVEFGF
jgi:hypothetical protein